MVSSPPSSRLFTVLEANALLPALRALMERVFRLLDVLRQASESVIREQRLAPDAPDLMERLQQDDAVGRVIQEIKGLVEEIHGYGCMCKGIERGLIDFPCLLGGEIVFLCWRYGEERVSHWHRVEDGYAGRRPLIDPNEVGGGSVSCH